MDRKTLGRIEKINKIDSETLPRVLIRAQELFWGLDRIVDKHIEVARSRVSSNKKKLKIFKELIGDFREDVSIDYLNNQDDDLFNIELLRYLGFDVRDEAVDEIIFDYCTSTDKDKDFNLLKKKLIESAIELDGVDEDAMFKETKEEFEEEQEKHRLLSQYWI